MISCSGTFENLLIPEALFLLLIVLTIARCFRLNVIQRPEIAGNSVSIRIRSFGVFVWEGRQLLKCYQGFTKKIKSCQYSIGNLQIIFTDFLQNNNILPYKNYGHEQIFQGINCRLWRKKTGWRMY